ncbi:MAG: murein biosynthesis integral membrane protein MurJ, partial [Eggerthellaceae bacterium]|nr:murein biosynthesis integral membrane protein MurJ [Eggerthellaceae bacterium]
MSDKLARARHSRPGGDGPLDGRSHDAARATEREPRTRSPRHAIAPSATGETHIRGRHARLDRTTIAPAVVQHAIPPEQRESSSRLRIAPEDTGEIPVVGRHVGRDLTKQSPRTKTAAHSNERDEQAAALARSGSNAAALARSGSNAADTGQTSSLTVRAARSDRDGTVFAGDTAASATNSHDSQDDGAETGIRSVGSSAALISVCTIISRITGFARTWAMAFALGASALAGSYQVANNLPNMLYELVAGGMLVTAFLPVYLSVKKRLGHRAGNEYASNLLTIVVLFLGVLSALCVAFPGVAIYTQSFFSDQGDMQLATYFFRFFAIQIVFYGASSIVSGLLNANRDYLWSSIAPVANNII